MFHSHSVHSEIQWCYTDSSNTLQLLCYTHLNYCYTGILNSFLPAWVVRQRTLADNCNKTEMRFKKRCSIHFFHSRVYLKVRQSLTFHKCLPCIPQSSWGTPVDHQLQLCTEHWKKDKKERKNEREILAAITQVCYTCKTRWRAQGGRGEGGESYKFPPPLREMAYTAALPCVSAGSYSISMPRQFLRFPIT